MAEKFLAKNLMKSGTKLTRDHTGVSHTGTKACDYSHPEQENKVFTAPFKVKVRYWSEDANTLVFESLEPVELANGMTEYVCFTMGHMEDEDFKSIYGEDHGWTSTYNISDSKTQIKNKGDVIYYEGNKGDSNGVHNHIRIGLGKYTGWVEITKGYWDIKTTYETSSDVGTIYHDEAFFVDDFQWATNSVLGNYDFITSSGSDSEDNTGSGSTESTGVYLQGVLGGFYIRETAGSGTIKTTVSAGEKAEILEFVPGFIAASDGKSYQWAKVKKGTIEGYAQLDLHQDYKIVCDSTFDPIYLRAVGSQFNIRSQKNTTSTILGTVAAGSRIELIAISSTHENGGYQWARVDYNGQVGFVQIDTVGFNQLEF